MAGSEKEMKEPTEEEWERMEILAELCSGEVKSIHIGNYGIMIYYHEGEKWVVKTRNDIGTGTYKMLSINGKKYGNLHSK